ncbi:MAG: citrate/2-methylcitrate synthase [Acidimicrobiales bacterium]
MTELIEVPPGLAGVAVASTSVGDVVGDEGFYHYRGANAVDLARSLSFEEIAALVLDESGAPAIATDVVLPSEVAVLVPQLDLRSALSLVAQRLSSGPLVDLTPAQRRSDAVTLISLLPTLVASCHHGERRAPTAGLGHAAGYLEMLTGTVPSPEAARALEIYLSLTIDHGFNVSTFATRVIASTGADLGACLLGGLAALLGPRHGGAPRQIADMFDGIEADGDARRWMRAQLAGGGRLPGFGHSVYRAPDPRGVLLAEVAASLVPDRFEFAQDIERAGQEILAGRRLVTNVDFYASVVLSAVGIPRGLFAPTFAVARVVGWCAHILEQAADRKIIRPAAYYIGPPPQH